MPRCALYARASTADKGQTPQNQLRQLRAFARSQGWPLVARDFLGVKLRTALNRLRSQL